MSYVKIGIACTQRFDITVTRELVALLTKLGGMHYDGVCQSAVVERGFIYGWRMHAEHFADPGEKEFVKSVTNRDLQTCLKIVEFPPPNLTPEEYMLRNDFTAVGFGALRQADTDERFTEVRPTGGEIPDITAADKFIDIVFDGPPSNTAPQFVEVENEHGFSIRAGTWIKRPDKYWVLRIPRSATVKP